MKHVEFRYYQCLLNPTSGDRVTIALVFWDGTRLRCAHSLRTLPPRPSEQLDLIRRALYALEERVKLANEQATPAGASLQQVFPVREGLGSLLFWSELRGALTETPELHFDELCSLLHLSPPPGQPERLTTPELFGELARLGERLASETPGRVKAIPRPGASHQRVSPLSWKNGRWHHTVPISFAGLDDHDAIREAAEAVIGRAKVTVPQGEVAVVVAALPDDPELAAFCLREIEVVREALRDQQAIVLAEPAKGQAYLHRIEQEARLDIAAE